METEDKYEFFYKPKTKKDIVEDREVIQATKYDLAQKIRELTEKQAIVLDYADPEQKLVPDEYSDSENFLKHGRKIAIAADRPMWESREEKFSEVYEKKQIDPRYFAEFAGIAWRGYGNDQRSRIVHLVDSCEAVRIYHYTSNSKDLEEKMRLYHRAEPKRKGIMEGANYGVAMISRSEAVRETVSVILKHVPFTSKGYPTRVISRQDYADDCPYNRFHNLVFKDYSSGRINPVFFDMHAIAAYLFVIEMQQRELDNYMEPHYKQQREAGKPVKRRICVAMRENPFPLPAQQTLNDLIKFENHVCIKDFKRDKNGKLTLRKDGKPRTEHRKTNRAEKELFLFQYIAAFGPRTFFATKRLREYMIEH
jgi:hypothetical protein